MSEAEAELRDAIEHSYLVFAGMPCPRKLETSHLRNGDEILRALTSAPLRELGGEQVGPYSGWAITTVGNDRDYRHFLPRIIELAVTEPVWLGTEPPVTASRLEMATWRAWPADQQSAVLRLFHAAFDAMIARHPDEWPSEAAEWFCGIANLGQPVAPPFERWRSSTSANAALNMARFIISESRHLRQHGEVRGSFWKDVSEDTRREVAQLLLEERTIAFLHSAAERVSEEDRFYHLDAAVAELARRF
ncbi:hypothetical protein [Sphingomonas sp.]|jgi:hypothetical protein|uniref:hypothetical protein n=1 Tax=Sphingomonas sp. TaxID=28214 RepID=UPI002E0EFAEB|nr:hypothetical protein [Sphingomonas sp.]